MSDQIITELSVQQSLAKLVKERAVHLTAMENFKERKKEMVAELTELLGKGHGKDIEVLALSYIKDQKKVDAAKVTIDKFEEAAAEVDVLSKYMEGKAVADLADEYMGV